MKLLLRFKDYTLSQQLLLSLLFLLPFDRIPTYNAGGITFRLSMVAALALIIVNLPALWKRHTELIRTPWVWLAAYLGVGFLSIAVALSHSRSAKVFIFTAFVCLMAWAIAIVAPTLSPRALATALLLGTAVTIIFGLYQFFGDMFGLPTTLTGLRATYTKAVFGFPRIQSVALEPLYYANYLLLPAALALLGYIYRRRTYGWVALAILTIIWLCLSRGAYYALIAILVGCIALAIGSKRYERAATTLGIALVSAALAVGLVAFGSHFGVNPNAAKSNVKKFEQQTVNTNQGESVEGRTFSRNYALSLFKQHPILGIGLGNYGIYGNKYHPERYGDTNGIVNNETIEILAETGLLGFGAIALFVITLGTRSYRYLRTVSVRQPTARTLWVLGLGLSLIGTAIQYQAFSTLYIVHIWAAIGLLVGLTAMAPRETRR